MTTAIDTQAECEVAYDAITGQPLKLKHAPDAFRPGLLDAECDCRAGALFGKSAKQVREVRESDTYRSGCRGCHVNYAPAERPKLSGINSTEAVLRILGTPMWRGSKVRQEERFVRIDDVPDRREKRPCFIITHPSGAEMTLRADL